MRYWYGSKLNHLSGRKDRYLIAGPLSDSIREESGG